MRSLFVSCASSRAMSCQGRNEFSKTVSPEKWRSRICPKRATKVSTVAHVKDLSGFVLRGIQLYARFVLCRSLMRDSPKSTPFGVFTNYSTSAS